MGSEKLKAPNPPPRYDDVFTRGMEWLDSMTEEEFLERRRVILQFLTDLERDDER